MRHLCSNSIEISTKFDDTKRVSQAYRPSAILDF